MAFITLRQSNVVTAPNVTIKGSPLTNSEVDNNFANINIQLVDVSNAALSLGTTINNLSSSEISNGTSSLTVLEDADIIVTGNIVPSTNVAFNLGNTDFRFKDLFLSGNTINLGGLEISVDTSGNLLFNSNVVITPTGQLNTTSIPDGSIVEDTIGTGAVTETKIGTGAVTEAKIGTGAVTTDKIADGNVTTAKLAVSGVTAGDYGNATLLPTFTVGVDGRITSAANIAFSAGATLEDNTDADASYFPTLATSNTGSFTTAVVSSSKLFFNPSSGELSATDFNSLSDITLKENINTINNPINFLQNINGIEFTWSDSKKKSAGIIAQEVEKVLPHLVRSNNGLKTVNYSGLIGYLVETVKELNARIEKLERKD